MHGRNSPGGQVPAGSADPDPLAPVLHEAVARLSERYREVLPAEAVAAVVWAAAQDTGPERGAPDRVARIVARAAADLALAVGAPTHGQGYAPASALGTAWTHILDGLAVVRAVGEFDVDTGVGLGRELDRALASGRRLVLVDLGRVSFMDQAGLAPLRAAARGAARVLLVQVPERVRRVVDACGAAADLGLTADPDTWRRTG